MIDMNIGPVLKLFQQIETFGSSQSNAMMERLSNDVRNTIVDRVQSKGVGVDKRRLKPYSSAYSRYRARRGRKSEKRDLTFSGDMMQSMTVLSRGDSHVISFLGEQEKKKALANEANTPFFSIGIEEEAVIDRSVNHFLGQL